MNHLITGGNGFLGSLIAKRLVERGEFVVVCDIWEDPNMDERLVFEKCDVTILSDLENLFSKYSFDVVHNNVALVPLTKSGSRFRDVNVEGVKMVAEFSVRFGVKHFIHMSSSAIYGSPTCPIDDLTPLSPIEIYGQAKLDGELAVQKVLANSNVQLITIRPRTILGNGRLGIFQVLFEWIRDDANVFIIGQGANLFQFIHAEDLMDFYMIALDKGRPGTYNVGALDYGTLRNDLETLIRVVGSKSRVVSLPSNLSIATLRLLDILRISPLAPWHYLTYHKEFYFATEPLTILGWRPKYSNQLMLLESYTYFISDKSKGLMEASAHRKPIKSVLFSILKYFSRWLN